MKATLLDGTKIKFDGASVKDVSVSIFNDLICITLFDGTVYEARKLETTKVIRQ